MRILHLLATGLYSGAENVALTIMSAMPGQETVYASPDGPIRKIVESRDLNFYGMAGLSFADVKRAITTLRPDIIHAHDPRMSCLAALAAPKHVKVISHLHHSLQWLSKWNPYTIFYHLCAGRFHKIAAVSETVMETMVWSHRFHKKWALIPNFVDLDRVRELSLSDAPETDILMVGRLSEHKDPLLFLRTLALLKQDVTHFHAAIVGDGELRQCCEDTIRELGLEGLVTLAGFRKNPYAWIARTKVLVMPSRFEGFGLVAVEALGFGVPVLCSGNGGLKNIVTEDCGHICDSPEEYAAQLSALLKYRELHLSKSRQALLQAARFSDRVTYQQALAQLYE